MKPEARPGDLKLVDSTRALGTYRINEVFYSLQGEGMRAGTANIFIRFSDCNLRCKKEREGFDCDTEFVSGELWDVQRLLSYCESLSPSCRSVIFTGGEPALQLDEELIRRFKLAGYFLAVETNGTKELPAGLDWICVSPKTAEHCLRQKTAHEVKYVRAAGMGIPKPQVQADYYLLSPAFEGDFVPKENLDCCIQLVKENPKWRLSVQQHKIWCVR
ncbi:MAG: 4Fe-4S cluster-binding domain-containing protein [Bradymonadales bacterium]|nr:MAG: 4Fe-4S cluster-binding domain-containing protein [Bradymonadales bacterium]